VSAPGSVTGRLAAIGNVARYFSVIVTVTWSMQGDTEGCWYARIDASDGLKADSVPNLLNYKFASLEKALEKIETAFGEWAKERLGAVEQDSEALRHIVHVMPVRSSGEAS
jgi:hypothetical protein